VVCVIVNCSGVNSTPLQSISDVTKGVSHFVNGLSANSGQMRPCMGFMLALLNSQSVNSGFDSRLRNDSMQVVHTCDSVSEQYNLVPVGAGQRTVIPCDWEGYNGPGASNGSLPRALWLRSPAGWL